MDAEYFIIGQILAPKGIKGEVRVYPLTDFPERFQSLETVWLDLPQGMKEVAVNRASQQKNIIVLQLEGYTDRNAVEGLRQIYIKIKPEQAVLLPEGHYYIRDIIGLAVYTTEGEYWGDVENVLQLSANDVYVLQKDGQEVLLPAIKDVVKKIDLAAGKMVIYPMEGLCK